MSLTELATEAEHASEPWATTEDGFDVRQKKHPHHLCWERFQGSNNRVRTVNNLWITYEHRAWMDRRDLNQREAELAKVKEELRDEREKNQLITYELSRLKREVARAGVNLLDSVRMGTTPKTQTKKQKTIRRLNLEPRTPRKRLPFDNWNVSSPETGPLLITQTPSSPFDTIESDVD